MRTTISFSITPAEAKKTQRLVRRRGFATTSEYVRFLLRQDDIDLITEDELVVRVKDARRLHKQGKLIKAASLAEFMSKSA